MNLAALLGGIGLFLLGMAMMTDGLKLAAGPALKSILGSWTKSAPRGLAAGALVTAVVQSSSATTVAVIGFVNAGLLTLGQAVWVIFGSNVGTTMTGWLVAQIGVKLDMTALALPLLGVGMLVHVFARNRARLGGLGQAAAGFGAFFLGIGILQGAFADVAPMLAGLRLEEAGLLTLLAFVGLGAVLTVLTQSSSAAVAIILTATAGGAAPLTLAAAAVIGTNIGTTSTALFAALGATPAARRVAMAHVAFNLLTGAVALILLPVILELAEFLIDAAGATDDTVSRLAAFHTLFNVLGVILIWPLAGRLTRWLSGLFVTAEEQIARPRHLDAGAAEIPELAASSLYLEVRDALEAAFALGRDRLAGGTVRDEAARQAGIGGLTHEIRGFIDRMNARPLPPQVSRSVPELLRAVQHAEDLTETRPGPAVPGAEAAALIAAARACLDLPPEDAPDTAEGLDAAFVRADAAYQAFKSELLASLAEGRRTVDAVDGALGRGRAVRAMAYAAARARRRLLAARPSAPPPGAEAVIPPEPDGVSAGS
ncbi:Na/Pi cotransporter family protein [Glycocaulis profundi]|nr:Na/Pi cotransporter family protein [Glycocaulis profundi]